MDKAKTLKELDRVLDFIERDELTQEEMKTIEQDTINNYNEYFNSGWMDFRKSITPDGATIEWASEGENIIDVYGNKYIDCIGGFGTYIAGHRNPEVIKAVDAQLHRLTLSSTELIEPLRGYACEAISMITPGDLKFSYLTNGGAEAVEMALKLAMLANGAGYFISTVHGFHGKSLGALSMTGNDTFRERYYPNLLPKVAFVEHGDAAALEQQIERLEAIGEHVTAFIVEPVQGESGFHIPPKGYLKDVRDICTKHGVLFIADEIQTGMGRTGMLWGQDRDGVAADIMTFGKVTSGGAIPLTGIAYTQDVFDRSGLDENPFILGSPTFGGNAIACSALLSVIRYIIREDIPKTVAEKGAYYLEGFKKVAAKHKHIDDVRGIGLMLAFEFDSAEYGWEVSKEMFAQNVLVAGTLNNARVIRIEPPAIQSYETIDKVIAAMDEALTRVEARWDK